ENLAKRVMLLRQALGDNAEQPRYIERVRCHGYRLIPAVEVIDGEDDAQVADSALAGAAAAAPRRGPFRLRWAAAAGAPLVASAPPSRSPLPPCSPRTRRRIEHLRRASARSPSCRSRTGARLPRTRAFSPRAYTTI